MNRSVRIAIGLVALAVTIGALSQVRATELQFVHPFVGASAPAQVTIIFGGDMMFDRSIRQYADRHGGDHLLACLDPLLNSADLAVANLEGPITDRPSISLGSLPGDSNNYTFTFPTTTAALLARHNVRYVTLGNNHILNFGWDGVRSTRDALSGSGVGYFGDPPSSTVAHVSRGGVPIALIGYNQFAPEGWRAAASTTVWQIRAARAGGELPVVFAHWGEEYSAATDGQRRLAHAFADAGAVLVVGAHPHVVQESERYEKTPIYYSLGNLVFDQYWNDAVSHGLLIAVTFDAAGVAQIREMPVVLQRDRQTCPVSGI